MPLEPVDHPAQAGVVLEGIAFPMKIPNAGTIGVVVTYEALQEVERMAPPASEDELVARCEAHRSKFEAIASAKFDAGQKIGPIHITATDWAWG